MEKNKIIVVTDSTSSLTPEECKEKDIECLQTTYMVDNVLHDAFDDQETSIRDFYEIIDKAKTVSTGCVNVQSFEDCFDEHAKNGEQVIYTGLSSSLSSTFDNSVLAAKNINEKYGKKMIAVVDSRSGCYGAVLLAELAKDLINQGKTLDEIEDALNEKSKVNMVAFVCRDLSFLQKSGRIGAFEAKVGKFLHIVPIVSTDQNLKLKPVEKCLGTKNAYKSLKNRTVKQIKERGLTKCYIASCGLDEDAELLKQYVMENTDVKEFKIGLIDKTLACCSGPKTIAVFCG